MTRIKLDYRGSRPPREREKKKEKRKQRESERGEGRGGEGRERATGANQLSMRVAGTGCVRASKRRDEAKIKKIKKKKIKKRGGNNETKTRIAPGVNCMVTKRNWKVARRRAAPRGRIKIHAPVSGAV